MWAHGLLVMDILKGSHLHHDPVLYDGGFGGQIGGALQRTVEYNKGCACYHPLLHISKILFRL